MIICDTGPLLAAAYADDSEHTVCLTTLTAAAGPLIVPALIVTEVCYMLAKSGPDAEAEAAFAVAERLGVTTVATLDHRHFRQVTPHHCLALELVPGEHQLARHRPPHGS